MREHPQPWRTAIGIIVGLGLAVTAPLGAGANALEGTFSRDGYTNTVAGMPNSPDSTGAPTVEPDDAPTPHPGETSSGYETKPAQRGADGLMAFVGIMFPIVLVGPLVGIVLMMRQERRRRERGSRAVRSSDEN